MTTKPNIDHPGWPDYTGPETGFVAFPWHREILVYMPSRGITTSERVADIKANKPPGEVPHRLACFVHIPDDLLPQEVVATGKALSDAWSKVHAARLEVRAAADKAAGVGSGKKDYLAWRKTLAARIWAGNIWGKAEAAWRKVADARSDEILAVVTKQVPRHTWNGERLVFYNEAKAYEYDS